VARSASKLWKLCTGRPSSVRPVVSLLIAAGDRCALATMLSHRFDSVLVGVVVEHRRQTGAHVPVDVIGEHAEEDVGAHAVGQPVVDRPDLQVDRLQADLGDL
jgi:hypothetical protein